MTKRSAESLDGPEAGLSERTIRVVEAVVNAGVAVGPRGLARLLGMDRSAVSRILLGLGRIGVLERLPDGYVPGSRLFAMARVVTALDTLSEDVSTVLGALVDRYDETCYVCTFSGGVAAFTHEIQSTKPLRFVAELGRPVPLHAGAAGRAILAGLGPRQATELLGAAPLPAITDNTVTDPARLLELLSEDRARGYSVSIEERVPGGAAIATPFFDRSQRCQGSVVFSAPLSRLDPDSIDEIGAAVADVGQTLSRRLGARDEVVSGDG
jgi:IclR family acetate operon transcriptional repressor